MADRPAFDEWFASVLMGSSEAHRLRLVVDANMPLKHSLEQANIPRGFEPTAVLLYCVEDSPIGSCGLLAIRP